MTYIIGWEQKEKNIFKLSKIRKMKSRDLEHVKCIKINDQKALVKDNDIKKRWKEYFSKLLNEDYVGDIGTREHTFFHIIRVVKGSGESIETNEDKKGYRSR